jgi:hypothetical protein
VISAVFPAREAWLPNDSIILLSTTSTKLPVLLSGYVDTELQQR